MNKWLQEDERFMRRALAIARRAEGRVEPNPMVGCVLVKRGRIVGEGYHWVFGGPHAEVNAIASAGRAANGATAYVTLEPCCHHGKTPPCTDAIIRSGVGSVIAAMKDPNPLVAGKGLRRLRAAGIPTRVGLLEREAELLTAPFITRQTQRRPYFILKWAQSLDGKIATRTGDSQWITSLASRRESHRLRARVDAVIVGVETVLADDPELTARHAPRRRTAARVVLDSRLRIPPTARVVRTANVTPTLIVTSPMGIKRKSRTAALEAAGCEVIAMKSTQSGISLPALARELYRRSMTNVMVEGGGRILGSFFDSGMGDEAMIFVAPRLIGGAEAPGPLGGLGPRNMTDLAALEVVSVRRLGVDLCYNVRFRR